MSLTININTIRHEDQRYDTVGDWWELGASPGDPLDQIPNIRITVSSLGDWRMEVLVAMHEMVECALCRHAGISDETVTAFDKNYENQREPGDTSEPGDAEDCPYKKQHFWAEMIERQMAALLDVEWRQYEEAIAKL